MLGLVVSSVGKADHLKLNLVMAQTSRYSNLIVSAQLKDDWDGTIYLIDSGQVGKTGGWGSSCI